MATLPRDFDLGRILKDFGARIGSLERRLLALATLQSQVKAIGVWQAFTPSWTGVTVGTGGVSAGRYTQIGQTVHVQVELVLGTGGDVTAGINLTPPLAANVSLVANSNSVPLIGSVGARDNSTSAIEKAFVRLTNTGVIQFLPAAATGSWNATVPFDWAVSDQLNGSFSYETTAAVP